MNATTQHQYSFPSGDTRVPTRWAKLSGLVIAAGGLFLVTACKENDPSYEKEAMKLTGENAALKTELEQVKKQLESIQGSLRTAQSERDAALEKAQKVAEAPKVDVDRIKQGFAKAVSGLSEQIESKMPHYSVESVTFQKMKMPTEYPFSSGVIMSIASKKTGQKQNFYWEGRGNLKGEWKFAQLEKPTAAIAAADPFAGRAKPPAPANPVAKNDKPTPATPSKPATPAKPSRPKRPTRIDPNTHIIDWGKLK